MAQYLSPGVYVEDVPPVSRPIAGVGTSTPGFIGVVPDTFELLSRPLPGDPAGTLSRWVQVSVLNLAPQLRPLLVTSWNDFIKRFGDLVGSNAEPIWQVLTGGSATAPSFTIVGKAPPGQEVTVTIPPPAAPSTPSPAAATAAISLSATASLDGAFSVTSDVAVGTDKRSVSVTTTLAAGTHAMTDTQQILAHAVYGFFNNGGGACYVVRVGAESDVTDALAALAAIDDISIVAAPGLVTAATTKALSDHCELLKDRVALLDSAAEVSSTAALISPPSAGVRPQNSSYAAFYFPWLQVADPASTLLGTGNGQRFVPPSGHVAGVYARSDAARGVHKAPANEPLSGVLDLRYAVSRVEQESLNGVGVNLIRPLIGAFRIWGARTVGGDANGEYRYISTRRYMNFLRKSIDEGTQWVVFEPNTPALWQRIRRTLEDFLTNQWRNGALFGETPKQAFFVKCDADTNPPEVREAGQVVTEIGVAIVKPAEFVIFRIHQTTGG